jgi:tetratricopeptide (TPR) repeat protein
MCNIANVLFTQGRLREANTLYAKALKRSPNNLVAVSGQAEVYERQGKADKARKLIARHMESGKPTGRMVLTWASLLERERRDEELVAFIDEHVGRTAMQTVTERSLLLMKGRALDRLGRNDEAFDAWAQGNALLAQPFPIDAWRQRLARCRSVYEGRVQADFPTSGLEDDRPVFVVGMPRSGSTLVEQIIHAHPAAIGLGEIGLIPNAVAKLSADREDRLQYPEILPVVDPSDLETAGRTYLDAVKRLARRPAKRLVDKSLENHELVGLLKMLFPNGKAIHIRRHPLDVCLSCYMHDLAPAIHPWTTDLRSLGERCRLYAEFMRFWREETDVEMLEVQYEHLVADPEAQSRRIIDFIGLPWDDACLAFHEAKRSVATISYVQVDQPMYRTAIKRFEKYGSMLDPLIDALGDELERDAAETEALRSAAR